MVKIRTQIDETLKNSKVRDTEKLEIMECAKDKYGKLKETMRPSKMTIVQESGTAFVKSDLTQPNIQCAKR